VTYSLQEDSRKPSLSCNYQKTEEEESAEIMWYVVYSTNMLEPIYVAYLSELESHDENTESDAMLKELSKPSGIAVKVAINKWQIHLDNETGRLVQLVGTVPMWTLLGV